jgi:transcriptional regulator with XRE-family HTH domain
MGNKITEARENKNWTQEVLADKSGVSRTIISGLESGRISNTTIATMNKIAEALGLSVNELFFG